MLTNHDDHHCKRHGYPQGMHERIMRIGGAVAICQKTRTPTMHPSKEEISTELKKILVEDLFDQRLIEIGVWVEHRLGQGEPL